MTTNSKSWTRCLEDQKSIQKILVMRWSAMGDVALASASFEDLHNAFPEAELHLNTLAPWDKLFAQDPRFTKIIALDLRGRDQQLKTALAWLSRVKQEHYDLIVDLQCTDRSRIMISALWLNGGQVPLRVGNARRFPYNIAPSTQPEPVHAHTRNQRALQAAGIKTKCQRPVLFPSLQDQQAALEKRQLTGISAGRYAVFLPGCQAAGYLKRWGAERYAALADELSTQGIDDVLLLGGPDEVEECEKIHQLSQARTHNLCGQTQLLELIPLAQDAALVVANDTGTAHVVATTGVPMWVICGPTDPRKVLPVGDHVSYLQADLSCINCYRKHCSHHSCMVKMTPDMVLKSIKKRGVIVPEPR